jgi:hypothetical protein
MLSSIQTMDQAVYGANVSPVGLVLRSGACWVALVQPATYLSAEHPALQRGKKTL